MTITKTYVAYSHTPGFRKLGRQWDRNALTIGVVEALPDDGSREPQGDANVDLLATKKEIERLLRLNKEEAYPLRLADGATDSTARQTKEARKELDRIRESINEARKESEEIEAELAAARAEREQLQKEMAELRDAVEAAEAEARKKEAEVSKLKKELAELKSKQAKGKKAEAK